MKTWYFFVNFLSAFLAPGNQSPSPGHLFSTSVPSQSIISLGFICLLVWTTIPYRTALASAGAPVGQTPLLQRRQGHSDDRSTSARKKASLFRYTECSDGSPRTPLVYSAPLTL